MAEEEQAVFWIRQKILAPARKLAVSSGQFKFSAKILAGMVRWSKPVRMVLGNISAPRFDPRPRGVLPQP